MPTLYHPNIPDLPPITVDAADVEANMKAGWRKTPPSNTPPAPKQESKPESKPAKSE